MTASTLARLAPAARQAIEWEVRLREGGADQRELQQFAHWRVADAAHDAAWNALQQRLGRLPGGADDNADNADSGAVGAERAQAVAQALRTDASARRRLLRTGFGVAVLCLGGAGSYRGWQALGLDADWRSATGERRDIQLADGTPLALDAGSRVYQCVGAGGALRLRLAQGQLLLRAALPLGRTVEVDCGAARLSARQAVFNVCRFEHGSVVSLDAGRAVLQFPGRAAAPIEGGQTLYVHAGGAEPRATSFTAASAWTRGLLVAERLPLSDLVDVFNRYRGGLIRTSGTAGQRRISGVFKLDDIERALAQVADILPVRLSRYGPYLSVLS